jgi:hypothetical protein
MFETFWNQPVILDTSQKIAFKLGKNNCIELHYSAVHG